MIPEHPIACYQRFLVVCCLQQCNNGLVMLPDPTVVNIHQGPGLLRGVTMEQVFYNDLRSTSKKSLYGGINDGKFETKTRKSYDSLC